MTSKLPSMAGGAGLRELLLGLLLTWLLAGCGARVELLAAVPEADANEVIAALVNAGIEATKVPGKEGMVGVKVDQAMAARAVDTLRVAGLPREHFSGLGQVFRKDGLISSPLEERARYLSALSQDLSSTLTRIDGVLFARVHLVLPERGRANEADTPSTAAVFIKHQKDANLELLQPQVRRMVVNSIPDLTSERVSIVLIPSAANQQSIQLVWSTLYGMRVEADALTPLTLLIHVLGALALAGLGGSGYLAWRFVWLPRKASAKPAGDEDAEASEAP